jgi:hypothetical protein
MRLGNGYNKYDEKKWNGTNKIIWLIFDRPNPTPKQS